MHEILSLIVVVGAAIFVAARTMDRGPVARRVPVRVRRNGRV